MRISFRTIPKFFILINVLVVLKFTCNNRINNMSVIKLMIGLLCITASVNSFSQGEQDLDEIKGTFTIYTKSIKETNQTLNEDQLLEIESLRKDTEDFKTKIGDNKVLIMSREKMEADLKWPKYTLENK